MTAPTWSNLNTAPPLCRHMIDGALMAESETPKFATIWDFVRTFGLTKSSEDFATMIHRAYSKLYEPDATCIHTEKQ